MSDFIILCSTGAIQAIDTIHKQIRELMTNYGKIDLLEYDGGWDAKLVKSRPERAAFWRSHELNAMVRVLQPGIIITERACTDEDIVTPEQVDAKITELQQTRASAEKVEKVLALVRPLTAAQAKLAHKWLTVWCFSDAMLQHAQTITMENCDKFSTAYMDKILERWHAEGIKSPDRIAAPKPTKKKGPASTNPEQSSLDEGFEEQLLKYRPKFNKKS